MTAISLPPATLHASAARVDGAGVLVRGASGSGKSSLVLALLMADRLTNRLISDDRLIVTAEAGRLYAAAPETIAGLIEIRGQGIVRLPYVSPEPISLVVDLEPIERCPRLPGAEDMETIIAGAALPRLILPIGQADGWIRVRAALASWAGNFHDR
ncbi:HPr kinase/phosphatase C-terminal domain-containing protein [Kaistia dalseonensis]|uniref:Serine kinase of HPr protein (Carbohydrate metabolism regulator) n=1 Tax=Kaistia dalseonensis TaxID=410840 RepID=A0ABU0H5E0_9HYPH|nr:HPr kinase/phosphatase C-terminal domain-containing protein [Kaistia dalseonensis]MCX5494924.1 HPr kinase/phosphatase C-terminal domain-containing protein [Kaistia dalseonensis]MDQ0437505.1 serine kinase of HPr protein (carbohydrate metabolism regulator) [Kaistia dalseonensis]